MSSTAEDPRSLLPLTHLAFQVLLALADADRHGYGIIKEVADRTDGTTTLRTGTLYTLIPRLVETGLVVETDLRPVPDEEDDERRRYYALTDLGRAVVTAEARRLAALVSDARRKRVLGRSGKA